MPLLLLGTGGGGGAPAGTVATPPVALPATTAMRLTRWQYADDWDTGTYQSARLDTAVYTSPYNHPAVIPAISVTSTATATGAQAVGATQPPATGLPSFAQLNTQGVGSAAWAALGQFAITAQAGDALQFSVPAGTVEVVVQLAGEVTPGQGNTPGQGVAPGSLRNGAVAALVVDGTTQQTVDTYAATPTATLYLDGNAHTVRLVHTGGYNPAVQPIGPVTPTVGATVAAMLAPAEVAQATFQWATWRVAATSATQYNLYKTPHGGTEALVQSGLVAGNHYAGSGYVPGVDLYVGTGMPLAPGDGATFTTDLVQLSVQSILLGSGTGSAAGVWTSPILDALDPQTQWLLAEWDQDEAPATVALYVGDTAAPDGTWVAYAATAASSSLQTATLPIAGAQRGVAGLMGAGRGRYGQIQVQFPGVTTTPAWVRDLALYTWVPERDTTLFSLLGFLQAATPGPLMQAVLGAVAVHLTARTQAVADYVASYNIAAAVDQWLYAYGVALGLPAYTAEPPQAYRTRLVTFLQSRATGGSASFIAQQMGQLSGVACAVTSLGSQQFRITVDAPTGGVGYPGLPGLSIPTAQAIMTRFAIDVLTPVASVITPGNALGMPNPTVVNVTFD